MARYDLLVCEGLVVNSDCVCKADIAINGERIVKISSDIKAKANRMINAKGKYVLPGIIDVHTHPVYLDDLKDLSRSAAHGGITTLIHYAYAKPGNKLTEVIDKFKEDGENNSFLDFGLHGGLFDPSSQAEEIPKAMEKGVNTFKMFMTYAKLGWMTDDYQLMRTLDIIAEYGGMGMVHAENGLATDYLEDKYNQQGSDPIETFLSTRPSILEAEAINRAISMSQVANCPLYIPHLSADVGVRVISEKKREGAVVFGETCPQYLTLTNEEVHKYGPRAKIGPPLRTRDDNQALWRGLRNGIIDVIASDHAPKQKSINDNFEEAPFGAPQVETILSIIYDEGFNKGYISLTQLVEKMSLNPARIFGFYPRKGILAAGSDADLVIFDPDSDYVIKQSEQHSNATYTLYEGRNCLGKPIINLQRGRIILENDQLKVKPGNGKFLKTDIDYKNLYSAKEQKEE